MSNLHYLFCSRIVVSNTYCVVFLFCLSYPMLPVSLDCPFLIALRCSRITQNIKTHNRTTQKIKKNKQHLGIGIHCGCLCGGSTLGYGVALLGNENENTGCDVLYHLLHSKFETQSIF
jgi:hypothetical protein